MKKNTIFLIFIFTASWFCTLSNVIWGAGQNTGNTGGDDAAAIIKKVDTVNNVADSKMEMTMTIIDKRDTKTGKKFTRIEKIGENNDAKSLIRFLEPPDVKGTSFLTIEHTPGDDEMWVYFASMRKVRKIAVSSSDRKDKFMGSDFTYGDMNRQAPDYNYTLLREEKLDEVDCYVIEGIPVDNKVKENDGYSRKIEWIRKDNYLVMKTEYYDLQNRLGKIFTASQPFSLGNDKWTMKKYEIQDILRNHKTIIDMDKIQVNLGIEDNVFTTSYLQRTSWSL